MKYILLSLISLLSASILFSDKIYADEYSPEDLALPPVVWLTGDSEVTISENDTYIELGATWVDNIDGMGTVLDGTPGENGSFYVYGWVAPFEGYYTLEYIKIDSNGNVGSATRVVRVTSGTQVTPTIELSRTVFEAGKPTYSVAGSSEPVTITNTNYGLDSVGRLDYFQGTISYQFYTTGSFTFTFENQFGVQGSTIITNFLPTISLVGGDKTLNLGDIYTDEGGTWSDTEDGSGYLDVGTISSVSGRTTSISRTGEVDTTTPGEYVVEYIVQDSDGNSISTTRTVTVLDSVEECRIVSLNFVGTGTNIYSAEVSEANSFISVKFPFAIRTSPLTYSLDNTVNVNQYVLNLVTIKTSKYWVPWYGSGYWEDLIQWERTSYLNLVPVLSSGCSIESINEIDGNEGTVNGVHYKGYTIYLRNGTQDTKSYNLVINDTVKGEKVEISGKEFFSKSLPSTVTNSKEVLRGKIVTSGRVTDSSVQSMFSDRTDGIKVRVKNFFYFIKDL